MSKHDTIEPLYTIQHDCKWCFGSGFVSVPDYDLIGQLGLFDKAMSGDWQFVPKSVSYCPHCFGIEPPFRGQNKKIRHAGLYDSLSFAKRSGDEYFALFKNCLKWHLSGHHTEEFASRMVFELVNGVVV